MGQDQMFAVYKLWLRGKALELGMSYEAAALIPQIRSGSEARALIDFLVHCYGADYASLQPWIKKPQPRLYLADNECYDEWEIL